MVERRQLNWKVHGTNHGHDDVLCTTTMCESVHEFCDGFEVA